MGLEILTFQLARQSDTLAQVQNQSTLDSGVKGKVSHLTLDRCSGQALCTQLVLYPPAANKTHWPSCVSVVSVGFSEQVSDQGGIQIGKHQPRSAQDSRIVLSHSYLVSIPSLPVPVASCSLCPLLPACFQVHTAPQTLQTGTVKPDILRMGWTQLGSSSVPELAQDMFPDTIPAVNLLLAQGRCARKPRRRSLGGEVMRWGESGLPVGVAPLRFPWATMVFAFHVVSIFVCCEVQDPTACFSSNV